MSINLQEIISYKTNRIMNEFHSDKLKPKLKSIVILLAYYSWSFFGKRIVLTDIFRTQKEQDKIYKNNKAYQKKPFQSVHQFWRGVDIRVRKDSLTKKEAQTLTNIANTIQYDTKRPILKTALFGDSLHKSHIHIQVNN